MNESLFACYDSLFCAGSEPQHSAIQLQDLPANTLFYNGQTEGPVQQLKQQQQSYSDVSVPAVSSNHQGLAGRDDINLIVASTINNVSNSTTFSNAHNNIPFVQIHTTNVQPQRSNYGNVFRRAVTNHAEIKSEPIKSEAADSSKDRVNATPTPPVRNVSCNSNERIATPPSPRNEEIARPSDTAISNAVPQPDPIGGTSILNQEIGYHSVRKCSQCRFICLDNNVLEEHILNAHSPSGFDGTISETSNAQIPCPGCSNVFFACKSLEVHLIEDHFASESDAKKFVKSVGNTAYSRSKLSTPESTGVNGIDKADEPPAIQERKSRIYLKNVECLREPRRDPLDIEGIHHNHIPDGFYQANSFNNLDRQMDLSAILNADFGEIGEQVDNEDKQHSDKTNSPNNAEANNLSDNRPKQKISIKSVDVLREPALLRRDYDIQNQFCNMENNCNELNFDSFSSFQPQSDVRGTDTDVLYISNGDEMANTEQNLDKPRRPKIYIKNVDILKEPIMLPSFATNTSLGLQDANPSLSYNFLAQSMQQAASSADFMNNPNNLGVTNQVYDAENIGQLPIGNSNISDSFLYDSVANGNALVNNSSNNGNGLLSEIGGVGGTESFQSFGNDNAGANTNFLTYPMLNCTSIDSSSHVLSSTPIITEPTPPPAPVFAMQSIEDTLCNSMESVPASTPPKQKQKIFIKNVDILKEPQFQEQRERGTLHLRTVDELNLMNRNEVESLIAPNLENNNVNSSSSFNANSEDHTLMQEEDDAPEQNLFYDENPLNSWSADDYDLGDDIDCIITDSIEPINNVQATLPPLSPNGANSSSLQKMIHDLETPQISMISIRDIEELTAPQHSQQPVVNVFGQLGALEANNPNNNAHCMHAAPLETHAHQHDGTTRRRSFDILNIMENEAEKPCVSPTLTESREKLRGTRKPERTQNMNSTTLATNNIMPNTPAVPVPLSTTSTSTNFNFNLSINLPPLMPVTNFSHNEKVTTKETTTSACTATVSVVPSIPVPPLVPVSSLVSFGATCPVAKSVGQTTNIVTAALTGTVTTAATAATATASTTTATTTSRGTLSGQGLQSFGKSDQTSATTATTATLNAVTPLERGRIYVANNLMQVPMQSKKDSVTSMQKTTSISITGGTSVRGRPFGSNRTDNLNKIRSEAGEVVLKCSVRGCAFRFKKPDTLAYHKRCHDSNSSSSQAKLCPECKSTDFGNWNTLHTHLWRSHQIDMELYSCSQCPFKTPIYSRLVNTHTKIHSEERNYKCEQCGKAFKNTKQLKNHRRWHRTHGNMSASSTAASTAASACAASNNISDTTKVPITSADLHRCTNCGAAFSHLKSLREHSCKNSDNQLLCSVCGHVASSKSSLKLHMFTHDNSKRLKCSSCTYSTSDHNAFRRHKMTHENTKMYVCPHCSYKSIQSVTFQKHVLMKHPDSAPTLIHKCKLCSYSTVNRTLFALHQIRHKSMDQDARCDDESNASVELIPIKVAPTQVGSTNCILSNTTNKNHNNNTSYDIDMNSIELPQNKIIKVKSDLLNVVESSSKEFFNIGTKSISPEDVINPNDGT